MASANTEAPVSRLRILNKPATLKSMILDRVLSTEESTLVLPALLASQSTEPFHARVLVQSSSGIEQWHVEIDRAAQEWFAVNETGSIDEFRDGTTFHDGVAVARATTMLEGKPVSLNPFFPEKLLWWGTHDLHFRPVLIENVGSHSLLLTFAHGADPAMRSTMVFDRKLGLISRLLGFGGPVIAVVDVEIGKKIERIVPRSFPELEVIEPNY